MKQLRVVLDTNVLISALLFGGTPREILRMIMACVLDKPNAACQCQCATHRLFRDAKDSVLDSEVGVNHRNPILTDKPLAPII